jgi:TonB family protein
MNTEITLINNNCYGAPELKKAYQVFTLKGFIIAITIHIALVAAYMLFAYINESKAKDIPINNRDFKIVEIETPPSVDDEEIPLIKKEEVTHPVKDLASLEPKLVRKEDADDVVMKTQDELNKIEGNTGREGDSLIASLDGNKIKIDDSKMDIVIKKDSEVKKGTYKEYEVEKAPVCINLQQVKSSLKYPELAIETGAEGRITVKVLVGEDGTVLKIGAVSGNELFHDEVKDKALDLQFTPGLQNNSAVKVWVTVPFNFKLK